MRTRRSNVAEDTSHASDAHITLDRVGGIPLHLQLEHQLEYLICTGVYREGDLIPSIRILSRRLRLSAGTVQRAYDQLAKRRLVEPHQGRGVVVQWTRPERTTLAFDIELRALMKEPLRLARAAGFSHEQIVRTMLELLRAQGERVRLVFLGFNEHVAQRYASLLEQELTDIPLTVVPVTLSAAEAREPSTMRELIAAQFMVTQLYHLSDAEKLTSGLACEVLPIMVTLSRQSHRDLETLPPTAKIGIVCPEMATPATFDAIAAYRSDRAHWIYSSFTNLRGLTKIRRTCEIVITTAIDDATSRKLFGNSIKTLPLTFVPSSESMARLRITFSRAALKMQAEELPREPAGVPSATT